MRHRSLSIGILAIACGLLAGATTAQAVPETWVSGTGADAGNCPITAPCGTFQFAHSKTTAGGSINVLSSGNFGPLTITKSISIVADGVEAVINTAAGAAGIIVNGSGIVVSLRGLTIDVSGNRGISFVSGAALQVQDCVIRRTSDGINFTPASGTSVLHIADSVIANSSSNGITVAPTGSGGAKVMLERVRVEKSQNFGIAFFGANTSGSITATVRDSVSAGNLSAGIRANDSGSGSINVVVNRTVSVNNNTGISALGAGVTILIGNSTVSGNVSGLSSLGGGAIASYGTNKVNGNGTDGAPTGTPIPMK